MSAEIGTRAPDFELSNQDGLSVGLESLVGKKSLIVFIPFPFTGVCESELCTIRDRLAVLGELSATVVAITCDTRFSNKHWSEENNLGFDVLSDFWPHGETARAYGAFNEALGCANRFTFVLDPGGVVRAVIQTDELGVGREFDAYTEALEAI